MLQEKWEILIVLNDFKVDDIRIHMNVLPLLFSGILKNSLLKVWITNVHVYSQAFITTLAYAKSQSDIIYSNVYSA